MLWTKSRSITTFTEHAGLYWYRCLSYSKSSTATVFQQILAQDVNMVNVVHSLANHIILFAPTRADHNAALKKSQIESYKCEFLKTHLEFSCRTQPEPQKISVLVNNTPLKTAGEVRSKLRRGNHSGNLSEI